MKCVLMKKVTIKEINEKKVKFYNYYLQFENGKRVDIVAKYINTENVKDITKKDMLVKQNSRNATRLDDFADVEE